MSENRSRQTRVVPIHDDTEGVHNLHTAFPVGSRWASPGRLGLAGFVLLALIIAGIIFWRSSWSALPITEQQISTRLGSSDPKELQRALVAIGERMRLHRPAEEWHPEVIRLSSNADQGVRARAAWVMGLDPTNVNFHKSLIPLLNDPASDVRGLAGISLAAFGDRAGHGQIVEMLRPLNVLAPHSGEVVDIRRRHSVGVGETILTLRNGDTRRNVNSPIAGVVGKLLVANGDAVSGGVPLAVLYPSEEHAWDALHALESLGDMSDLQVVKIYQGDAAGMPQNVIDEASAAEAAIRKRNAQNK
jgi:hypothetical protein